MSKFVLTAQLQLQAPGNVKQIVQQIQSQLNGVNVNIQVQNAGQAQKQIQQVAQATNQATTAAERMGKAFALSIRRFAAFSIATRAVGLFTSTLSDAIQTSIDFERQLIKISQVTGKSVSQLRGLTKQITSLSTGFGVASSDLLEVSTILAQAGLSADDTSTALRTLAKAALAPNFDSISETAEGAIAILAQFQEGVGSLEKQLGSINAVAGAFAVEASDLIDVIRRTGGVFKASGGDLNELLALFTSVRATTRESAESIGTGLRTIFTRIQRPKTIEFLKQFGVELVDLDGKFVGPYEAIKRLSSALAGLGEGDISFIRIAEELGGFRQIGKVLPLLQQFSTAQSALNVAMKAGDSLTQDAASAQAALAVRIMKVKEEFLALIRSVTETSTFQIMANTALSLASALIKIGDSIKPLLPMLAALAAFKLAKGMGSFFGGMMSGAASGRAYNKGGKVLGFARGGLVPGSGNRDTVPAMLSPGEFVIRKSSVNKMGAGRLAAMNENRYAEGGPMTTAQKLEMARGPQRTQALNQKNKKAKYTSGRDGDELRFSVNDGNIGAFFMNKEGTPDGLKPFRSRSFNITNSKLLSLAGVKPYKQKGDRMAGKPDTFSAKGILEAGNIQTFYPSIGDIKSGSLSQIIQNNVKTKLSEAVMSVANEVSSKKLLDIPPIDSNDALLSAAAKRIQSDSGAIRTTSGYLYEGVIDALTGARPASGNSIFDFPASSLQGNRGKLAALFGSISGISKLKQADAKASYSSKIIDGDMGSGSISSKIINSINNGVLAGINIQKKHFGGLIQKFADGGEVLDRGTQKYLTSDVVKAMRELQNNPALSEKDAIDLFNSRDARGDFIYTSYGGKGSIKPPKWLAPYKPPESAAYGRWQQNQANNQNRIASALSKRGKTMRDYETRREFATGGGVGTDTVPALLTPGEFVVNRSSAQRIGYGNLNRMNKVGKYANGGVVQHFAAGTTSGTGVKPVSANNSSPMTNIFNNFGANVATVSAALQAIAPPIDESSTGLAKLANSLLSLGTTIGGTIFALEAFGIKLSTKNLKNIFGSGDGGLGDVINKNVSQIFNKVSGNLGNFGRALRATTQATARGGSASAVMNTLQKRGVSGMGARIGGGIGSALGPASRVLGSVVSKVSGPLAALSFINTLVGSFRDLDSQLKSSIEAGKVEESSRLAVAKKAADFPLIGNLVGGWNDTIDSTLIYLGQAFGGSSLNSVKDLAASQAGAVKTQKDLEKAQKVATDAMSDFERGSISAAEALAKITAATSGVVDQEKRASDFALSNTENRAGGISGFGRNVLSAVTFGGVESVDQRNKRLGKESAEQIRQASQFQAQAFQLQTPARSATIRSALFANQSPDDIRKQLNVSGGRNSLQARAEAMRDKEVKLLGAGDKEGARAAADAAMVLEEQIDIIDKELANLAQEVKSAKEKFAALNLGFRSITSASDAAALKMDNLMGSFEAGNLPAARAAATLEAAMTSAGQNIKKVDFDSALNEVNGVFKAFGASQQQIDKFNGLLKGVAGVQREFPSIFETLKKELMSGELKDINNPTEVGKKFKDIVGAQLKASGIDEAAREQILAAMGDIKLDSEDVSKILSGDYSVLEKYLGEAGEEVKKNMKAVIDNYVKVNQQLIEATKKRIDAERNLVEAQKEALDLIMEGREIQAKYGGREVTNQERRQNLLAKSNVEGSRLGLSNMRTGDVPELRRRNLEIMGGFANAEDGRRRNGLAGARGVEADEFQKDLEKTYKTQIDTIRSLIKLEEDQLKIIEEKNKLEKESLESLAKGDIESFFKQQAAVGARAAIASGDQRSMNLYGSEALGAAASDIQRQKDAGVQSLYGQRLGGAGGLAEAAASAALSSMGVTDMRSAQIMAGTTGEEEASKSRLRELGGLLGETGQIGVQMAEMQVGTATIQAEKAELIVTNLANGGNGPVQNRARGGLIYASRGMFVPRGSDTVPAMLTPGEFVVNRAAVQRGNNLQILSAMNGGSSSSSSTQSESVKMSRGGVVKYFDDGGKVDSNGSNPMGSFDNQIMNKFAESLSSFNRNLTLNIDKLKQTSINIKLDSTNVNVNLNDGGLLKALKEEVKKELLTVISNQFKLDNNGNIRRNQTVLG